MDDRLSSGGLPALLPDPRATDPRATDDFEEAEYARRLRVWIQLSAYGLDSPPVATIVRALEDRMMATLTRHPATTEATTGIDSHSRLTFWAAFKSIASTLLQPGAELTRDEAGAALASLESRL
jgi:hypothetical protein